MTDARSGVVDFVNKKCLCGQRIFEFRIANNPHIEPFFVGILNERIEFVDRGQIFFIADIPGGTRYGVVLVPGRLAINELALLVELPR
jgi:hypothetical protein